MKIKIERGKKHYEVVPCGRRCQFARPFVDASGCADVCEDDCHCPAWWLKFLVDENGSRDGRWRGLREIGGGK